MIGSVAAVPSVSYSITVRLEVPAGGASVSQLTTAVEQAGGAVTALDVTASGHERLRIDVTCAARDTDHAELLVEAMRSVPGVVIGKISDRTFLMHLGGKIEMNTKHPIRNRDDLSMIYTPGVARVSLAIAKNSEDARRLTIKRNSIAVVTDGSAVLGLGNLGPEAALPVMEGKAALFKRFGDIDAWPLCLDTQDVDEIVKVVHAIAPGFAGIDLEDISAPRCFEVERRLRQQLEIPVFHDDQHGTAIVVLGALYNALRVVDKQISDVKIVMSGAGAAGTAVIKLLLAAGARDVVVGDIVGVVHRGRGDLVGELEWLAETPTSSGSPVPSGRPWSAPTSSSASRCLGCCLVPMWRRWQIGRSCSPWPTRCPRWIPPRHLSTRQSSPPVVRTSRTRSTTCWRSLGSSVACSTPAAHTSRRVCCWLLPVHSPASLPTTS